MKPKVVTVLQWISTKLSITTVCPLVNRKRELRYAQSSQKGPFFAVLATAASASDPGGDPAAVAAATDSGDRDVMVRFLSSTVAGKAGPPGKGQVPRSRVICGVQIHHAGSRYIMLTQHSNCDINW